MHFSLLQFNETEVKKFWHCLEAWPLSIFASRTGLRPTEPPVQQVPEAASSGWRLPWRESGHSPHLVPRLSNTCDYAHFQLCLSMACCNINTSQTTITFLVAVNLLNFLSSAILAEVSCGFPQSLQYIKETARRISHDHLLPNTFQFITPVQRYVVRDSEGVVK
jgi:hypothetical protein